MQEKAWKYINKFTKKTEAINENIKLESCQHTSWSLLEETRERIIIKEKYSERRWTRGCKQGGRINKKKRGTATSKEIEERGLTEPKEIRKIF